ncbi:hypothetical protein BGZ96_012517 [Linnemannia gamsii]|uniref:Maintenance of telomere capping protein 1 n=1 Tax=Linnemannia gamsii TaxID=64522 RepID=A0ABQ7JQ88_9FUNG|nr:hypothetical protein BGZ96_012517 [Linnemannia gamsii]
MSSSKDDVLQFLDSLDGDANTSPDAGADQSGATASRDRTASASSASGVTGAGAPAGGADNQDEQSVLDFLDEITQSASTPVDTTKATPPGSQGKSSFYDPAAAVPSKYLQQQQQAAPQQHQQQQEQQAQVDSRSSWLGSLWSSASEAVKNTQTVVQSSVKATMESQATKNLEERVKGFVNAENIGKIGNDLKSLTLSSMTTVLDVIAPPIAEHEVVEIWLAHDMVGYVGVEGLVYRAFSKVMEQTEGGDVIVHQGAGTNQNEDVQPEDRQLNACEGYEQAVKLAKANIEHLIKTHYDAEKHQSGADRNPVTLASNCPVFMAIQPCRVPRHGYTKPASSEEKTLEKDMFISYVIVLQDPTHKLEFESCSQSLPAHWLLIPYEENEWVEDRMVDCIRLAVGVIAQDYVWTRMKGDEIQRLQIQEVEAQAKLQAEQQQQQQEQDAKSALPSVASA